VSTIAEWLKSFGMSEYTERFAENRIDFSVLPDLTDQDLKELGVVLGDRRKILRAISQLSSTLSTPLPPPDATPAPLQSSAERRQLTVMFSDIVGSTELSTRLDPEDLQEVIGIYHRCCRDVIAKFGGFVARFMGDGVLAYFGYPQAHEDIAERAVGASLALVAAVTNLDLAQGPLRIRIGIATGLVVVGELVGEGASREQAGAGETFNLAARLQTLAEPDTVVIDATTRRLLGKLFEYRALGNVAIKGFAQPMPLWQVTGTSAVDSRFEALHGAVTPLVNREEEIELLLRRWHQAKAGDGSVVLMSGEAGIGKSRIVQTVLERLSGEPHTRLRYFCSPQHQDSPLYPTITQLQRAAGFRREDTAEQRLDKLEVVLAQAASDIGEVAALFAELLSIPVGDRYPALELSPQKRKQRTLQVKVAQVEGLAARQPLLMVSEDVHWSDPTSLELLDMIVERVPSLPVLLIVTFRPEFSPRWVGRAQVTLLSLNRLAPRLRAQMVTRVSGGKELPKEIVDQIIDRTDGVPLFIEELTKTVIESGVVAETNSRYTMAGLLAPLAIPTTLQASLLSRLDRLAPVREVAQIAAAIGRQFSHDLISAAARMPQQLLDGALAQLVDAELIFRRGTPPAAEYTFKHALVQDTAYQSLLRGKRQQYHLQIAEALTEQFPEIVETQPELLAHHYSEADLRDKAIPFWQAAGQKAAQRSANVEAVHHLTRGLELLRAMPASPERTQQELALLVALGTPLTVTKGFASPEVGRVYARARELCQHVGGRHLFPVLWGLWVFYTARAEHKIARELGEQCHRLAEDASDPELLIAAHHAQGVTLTSLGELCSGLEHLEQAISIFDPTRHRPRALISGVACRSQAALALWFRGQPDQALKKNEEALILAQGLSRPYSLAQASAFAAVLYQLLRDRKMARARAETAIELSTEHEFPFWRAMGMIVRGWTLTDATEAMTGVAEVRQGLAAFHDAGGEIMRPYFLAVLAELYGKAGESEAGLSALSEAQAAIENSGERCWEPELYRLKAGLMLQRSDRQKAESENQKDAETCLRQALDIARRQRTKSWELRAALDLSRLLQRQGKAADAKRVLTEVHGWFNEGFWTADLEEAKTVLAELSRR
jgi:class 3 adenylate cyclase/predicted ATPase